MERKYILSADKALMKLRRMAYEVIERNSSEKQLVLAGIKGNGYAIAKILKSIVFFQIFPPVSSLSLSDLHYS